MLVNIDLFILHCITYFLMLIFLFYCFLVSYNYIERGSFPIPIYLGCYSETPNDDENRLLKGPAGPYKNNTPQRCLEICFRMGYLYFGNTYG